MLVFWMGGEGVDFVVYSFLVALTNVCESLFTNNTRKSSDKDS